MSGLLAARDLADAYQQVTVVERDPLPDSAADRKGVPQGRHAHGLLPRGGQILGELFPGLLAGLVSAGVPVVGDQQDRAGDRGLTAAWDGSWPRSFATGASASTPRPATRRPWTWRASPPIALDITDPASVAAAARAASGLAILVNNAGSSTRSSLLTGDLAAIRLEMDTHFFGTLAVSRSFAPQLAAQHRSAVLNILSVLSWLSTPGPAPTAPPSRRSGH